jgi:hypothetical protein
MYFILPSDSFIFDLNSAKAVYEGLKRIRDRAVCTINWY